MVKNQFISNLNIRPLKAVNSIIQLYIQGTETPWKSIQGNWAYSCQVYVLGRQTTVSSEELPRLVRAFFLSLPSRHSAAARTQSPNQWVLSWHWRYAPQVSESPVRAIPYHLQQLPLGVGTVCVIGARICSGKEAVQFLQRLGWSFSPDSWQASNPY